MHSAETVFSASTDAPRAATPARDPASRFELIAARSEHRPARQGDLLGLLLQAALAPETGGHARLTPLWAEEGMHRAYAMLRLLDKRAERDSGRALGPVGARIECALARSLAAAYRSVAIAAEDPIVPCSTLLREVVLTLGALFGSEDGIVLTTLIERLNLPGYRRRALVLLASELVINALTHAFRDPPRDGRIDVSLRRLDHNRACLRVADNGIGLGSRRPKAAINVAGSLATLIGGELAYDRAADWATAVKIVFPLPGTSRARPAPVISMAERRAACAHIQGNAGRI